MVRCSMLSLCQTGKRNWMIKSGARLPGDNVATRTQMMQHKPTLT